MTKPPAKKAAAKMPPAKKQAAKKMPKSPQALVQEMMRVLTSKLGPDELIMPEDVNALLASLNGPSAYDGLSNAEADAKDEAQEVAFAAMEAGSAAEARKLAKRALRLDPDCVDALVVLTDLDARTKQEEIAGLRHAVEAGERSLGAKFIRENTGHFWLLIETRPYMRALESLAGTCKSVGLNLDAAGIYEKMLELNPNDNQGVRDPLLGLYLALGDLKGAGRLLEKHKDDAMANFVWGRVLERFLAGDEAGARAALKEARKVNHFVQEYLTAKMRIPEELPEMYSPGSEEEATLCMEHVGLAWSQRKEAVFWLLGECAADGVRPVPTPQALLKEPVKGKRVQ
jgi:tetratricopeptide (TPR) repeat protein